MKKEQPKIGVAQKKAPRKKPKCNQTAAQIRDAAAKIKNADCKLIVESLLNGAKTGEIQSIKLLYSFAHSSEIEDVAAGSGARKLRSMAAELANAPEWTGDSPKEENSDDDDARTVS